MAFRALTTKQREDAQLYKFEKVGDSLTGSYQGFRTYEKEGEQKTVHQIRRDSGELVAFFGVRMLNDELPGVAQGTLIRITLTNPRQKTKDGKRFFKAFNIEVDDAAAELAAIAIAPVIGAVAPAISAADVAASLKTKALK
jgi:hypothetical protein